jgi:hypothetical protein
MIGPVRSLCTVATLLAFAGSALAADQPILGSQLQLKNPGAPSKTSLKAAAKEKGSTNTLVGDPVVSGAVLTVRANGGTPSSQTFNLPQGSSPTTGKPYWSGNVTKGFVYKDSKLEQGPIKQVSIKKTSSGVFQIKIGGSGKVTPLTVLPPNLGTDGCVLLELGGGDTYSVQFPAGNGKITNKGALQYSHKKPTLEGTCVTTTTTSTSSTSTSTTSTSTTSTSSTSSTTSTSVPPCGAAGFDYGITAFVSATLRNWPGGSQLFGTAGCNVTVTAPSGNISNLSGDTWTITSVNGFSGCGLVPLLPSCNTVGAVANILGNGRPYCSNSSDVFASGPSTAHVLINCNP